MTREQAQAILDAALDAQAYGIVPGDGIDLPTQDEIEEAKRVLGK